MAVRTHDRVGARARDLPPLRVCKQINAQRCGRACVWVWWAGVGATVVGGLGDARACAIAREETRSLAPHLLRHVARLAHGAHAAVDSLLKTEAFVIFSVSGGRAYRRVRFAARTPGGAGRVIQATTPGKPPIAALCERRELAICCAMPPMLPMLAPPPPPPALPFELPAAAPAPAAARTRVR